MTIGCKNCDFHEEKDATVTFETTEATCVAEGETVYTATVTIEEQNFSEEQTKVLEVDPNAHDWSDATYTWEYDPETVTATCNAKRTCKHEGCKVVLPAEAKVTAFGRVYATCTEAGHLQFTADFDNTADQWGNNWDDQTSKVYEIDPLDHTDKADDGDHVCDREGCDDVVTTCIDSDTNHVCDNDSACTVYRTGANAHADNDTNHACDYGCKEAIGTCEDADKDHDCDYGCDKTFGTCEDADFDHDCDYGCDKVYGTHEDSNSDHACDYGCKEAIGTHADSAADDDHVCDYGCGAVLEDCSDKPGDGDHNCDICGEENVTYCVDVEAPFDKCDECGAAGICKHEEWYDATCTAPKTCKHCGATDGKMLDHIFDTYTSNNDATCTKDGTETATCSRDNCGVTDTRTVENSKLEHDFGDEWENDETNHWHECECGAKSDEAAHSDETNKDHKCDACGYTMSECADSDSDGDHNCDHCNAENATSCVDSDKDHVCDTDSACTVYSTGDNTHADAADDNDHVCDYCDKAVDGEECADTDKNHKCDECDKTLSECADGNKDHKCDVCDAVLSQCADNDADHKCDVCDAVLSQCADNDADHKCDVCDAVLSECKDNDQNGNCDICGASMKMVTITFVDYFGNKTTDEFRSGAAVVFPDHTVESFSFELEFLGWADNSGTIVNAPPIATEGAKYTATYRVKGFKEGSLQMSVEYGAEGNIVLYATLFVYADTKGQPGDPVVLQKGSVVEAIDFEFADQTVFMYKIGLTADDIADSSSYIQVQIGTGDRMYEQRINQVLFQYAAMLKHAGIVDGEENAKDILEAQQVLIDSIIRYGGAVQDCFEEDHSDVTTHGMLTATKDILSGFDKLDAERIDRDDGDSAITTKFDAATGVFGTMISLEYYYTVNLDVDGATVSVIVADSRAELEGLSGEFKPETALTAKRYMSRIETVKGNEYYVSTTDGMTINEMEDKYAIIYVTYTVGNETVHYYGDIVEYGIERFAQRQIKDYTPASVEGGGGETVSADKTYNTEQYVNMLLRILKAHEAAEALEALRVSQN